MNEKEKMLNGELYNSMLDGLPEERLIAKKLCFEYNHTNPEDTNKRVDIIKKLIGKIGNNFLSETLFQ